MLDQAPSRTKWAADQTVLMKLLHQTRHKSLSDFRVANFTSSCMQSRCFSMLSVIYSSGVSRATLSCSLRPSARSSSSQTSSPSPPILMSCMRMPKISLEGRCVLRSMDFSFSLHHGYNLAITISLFSGAVECLDQSSLEGKNLPSDELKGSLRPLWASCHFRRRVQDFHWQHISVCVICLALAVKTFRHSKQSQQSHKKEKYRLISLN